MTADTSLVFHIQAMHKVPLQIIQQMMALALEEYGVDPATSLTTMHDALHRASDLMERAEAPAARNGRTCTQCHLRPPVVILTDRRLCAPCALTDQAGS